MNNTIVEPKTKKNLFKDRPVTLIIAAGLLLLLILVYAVLPLTGLERSLGGGRAQGFNRGQFTQNFDPNNLPQGQFQQGQGIDQNSLPQGRTFNSNTGLSRVFLILTNIMRWTIIALGALAIVGLWLKKRWGIVLAILISVIAFASTVPSLFRQTFSTYTVVQNVAILLLSVGVIVLSLLPRSRKPAVAV
jgi:uncharacterized membrane protein (DUF2068 family)